MFQHRRTFLVVCLLFLSVSYHSIQAQEVQEPDNQQYDQGIQLFEDGLYTEAAEELNRFIDAHPEHNLVESAGYYQVRALGKVDSVNLFSYYEGYIRNHPNNVFTQKLFIELAHHAEEELKFDEAISYYERSIEQGPNIKLAPKVYYWMAEAYISMGDKENARSIFKKLADTYPESDWSPKALYARGRIYLSENKFDSSSVAFELLKDRYPNSDITRRIGTALGESYYQQGKYKMAIEAFRNEMPYLDGDFKAKAVYLTAESYNYLNNLDQASKSYKQYINLVKGTDDERKAHYGLGWVYHKQEIYHWAARSFNRAAKGKDELARKALYYKAVNEKLGGKYAEAIETFRTFGDRYKDGLWIEEGYYEWAVTAYEMGNYSESIEVLLPLVRSDKELKWAGKIYLMLGEAYFANREYSRSLQAFDAAQKLTDVDPSVKLQARFQKAWVQYRNQAYKQAQPAFENVYEDAPNTELGKEALFWSADSYYSMEDYGPASSQFAEFIRTNPESELLGAARYSLGWSYFKMAEYSKAINPLKAFLENYDPPSISLFPYDTDTKLRLGDSYYALGDYENAIKAYKKARGSEEGGDYAMFQIASSYYRAEQTYEAVSTFRKFSQIHPMSRLREQATYNIGYIYLNTGNYSQAIKEFQNVINKYPNTSWAARSQYNIGDTYYNAGDFEKAIEAYKKVMQKYPDSEYVIEAVNGVQYAQISSGGSDSSSSVLEDFLEENPQTSTADRLRYRQAENEFEAGNYQGAIEEFNQYIRITNKKQLLPDAHFSLGNAYEQTGQTDKALNSYKTVIEEYSGSERAASALAALGRIAFERGNYQSSFDYYQRLSNKGGNYRLEARIGMGNAQLEMGNVGPAKQEYDSALEVKEDYAPAIVGLGKVALRNNNYFEGERFFASIAEENTTEIGAEAQFLLGVTRQQEQKYESALEAYANVRTLYEAFDNWVAKSLLRTAECQTQLGEAGEARSTLTTLVERYPESEEAKSAQRLLQSN